MKCKMGVAYFFMKASQYHFDGVSQTKLCLFAVGMVKPEFKQTWKIYNRTWLPKTKSYLYNFILCCKI